jgi:nucleoside-triphosphatase THEP1
MNTKNLLLTGPPGCGKSTVIEKLIARIDQSMTGFFTRELRDRGRRVGFSIITLCGKQGVLAHERSRSPVRVGKYGVNVEAIDLIAVPSLSASNPTEIVVIDEIGKMECESPRFRETVLKVLDSENPVIGSIAQRGGPFIQKMRERQDVTLVGVSETNRDSLLEALLRSLPRSI